MIKVLLVDDVEMIIEGLKVMIDWKNLGFEICGEAFNGEEGLEKTIAYLPDVVITDIRMPVINGLELIGKIKEVVPKCKVIILSGYNDFEYARTALDKGAVTYLLKPISCEELTEKLVKLKESIETENHKSVVELNKSEELLVLNSMFTDNFWICLVEGSVGDKRAVSMRMEKLKIKYDFTKYRIVVIFNKGQIPLLENKLVKDILIENEVMVYFNYDSNKLIGFIKDDIDYNIEKKINKVLHHSNENISSIIIGISECHNDLVEANHAFMEAKEGIERQVFLCQETSKLVIFNKKMRYNPDQFKNYTKKKKEIYFNLSQIDITKYCENINSLFDEIVSGTFLSISEIFSEAINITYFIRGIAREWSINNDFYENKECTNIEYLKKTYNTHWKLKKYLIQCAQKLMEDIEQLPEKSSDAVYKKIIQYINENLDKVTRDSVSDKFFMNSSYFSVYFKKRNGQTFNQYLTITRLEKAIELLLHSEMKIYDIGETIGYSSNQHFMKLFKEYTGCSPGEYRKVKHK